MISKDQDQQVQTYFYSKMSTDKFVVVQFIDKISKRHVAIKWYVDDRQFELLLEY